MEKKYKHLFFDLDRTLWDFEANSLITLEEIFINKGLKELGIPNFNSFLEYYTTYNHHLWELYKVGKIEKEHLSVERFYGSLRHFNIHDQQLASLIANDYITISPTKTKLFPDTIMVLQKLSENYQLHIITNGFNEVQFVKLKNSGLEPFFQEVITSEMIGVQKPNPKIFEYALQQANAQAADSVMIGDDQDGDIKGAQNAGMKQVYVNYDHQKLLCQPTWHIHSLKDLLHIF
jgi:putative hydrolase of the HAD superfamily